MIALLVVVFFPVLLLAFMLFMERVERPLRQVAVERDVEQFLDQANKSELDAFVLEGTDQAVGKWRTRLSLSRRRVNGRRRAR
jgi:uncharacterized NAD-dependent epimerase/dehydratase family protein